MTVSPPSSPVLEDVLDAIPLAARRPCEPTPTDDGRVVPAIEPEVDSGNRGPSWLQPGFEVPTKEGALRALASEISARTLPLNNLCFNNAYFAALVGGTIFHLAHDAESLAGMGEMGVEEATNLNR